MLLWLWTYVDRVAPVLGGVCYPICCLAGGSTRGRNLMSSVPFVASGGGQHLVSDPDGVRYEVDTAGTTTPAPDHAVAPLSSQVSGQALPTGGRIVVGVDGSPASVAALTRAVRIAESMDCSIEAFICWTYPSGYGSYPVRDYSPGKGRSRYFDRGSALSIPCTAPRQPDFLHS